MYKEKLPQIITPQFTKVKKKSKQNVFPFKTIIYFRLVSLNSFYVTHILMESKTGNQKDSLNRLALSGGTFKWLQSF